MEVKIIFWTVIVYSVISVTSTTLKGGINALCTRHVSYRQSQISTSLGGFRKESSPAWVEEQICCPGWENMNGTCKPRCALPCENGYCVKPNTCACDEGYQPYLQGKITVCKRKCEKPCVPSLARTSTSSRRSRFPRSVDSSSNHQNSSSESDKATGDQGGSSTEKYEEGDKETLDPTSRISCLNGTRIAAENCTCDLGFQYNSTSTNCDPVCNKPCMKNGFCAAPDKCECSLGFQYNSTSTNCDPVCTETCINGICQSPETCVCLNGYAKSSTNSSECEAVCESCVNGFCKTPGECICNEGFVRNKMDNKTCTALCKPGCVHGACSATGCVCDSGWGGSTCEESFLCVVSKTLHRVSVETESDFQKPNTSDILSKKPLLPVCLSACFDHLNSTSVNFTQNTVDERHYFININASCNIVAADSKSSNRGVIGAVLGILVIAMTGCAAYYVTKKLRKIIKSRRSESTQCLYTDYMEL